MVVFQTEEQMLSYFCHIGKSKWLMLFFYFVMIVGNGIVSKTVHYSTNQLKEYMNLSAKELQGITVSATHILSIPLSLFGTYVIAVMGITESTIIWQIVSFLGWLLFCHGVSNKSKLETNAGRIISGGPFGIQKVSITTFCTIRFNKANLSLALGCLSMGSKLSMIIGR